MTGFFSSLFSFELEIIEGCKLISLPLSLLNIRETFKLFTSSLKLCAGIGATKYLLEFNSNINNYLDKFLFYFLEKNYNFY